MCLIYRWIWLHDINVDDCDIATWEKACQVVAAADRGLCVEDGCLSGDTPEDHPGSAVHRVGFRVSTTKQSILTTEIAHPPLPPPPTRTFYLGGRGGWRIFSIWDARKKKWCPPPPGEPTFPIFNFHTRR